MIKSILCYSCRGSEALIHQQQNERTAQDKPKGTEQKQMYSDFVDAGEVHVGLGLLNDEGEKNSTSRISSPAKLNMNFAPRMTSETNALS